VIFGTLYPLVLSAFDIRISVGAPFFGLTFIPLVVPLLMLVPFGPLLAWKRGDLRGAAERLLSAFAVAIAGAIVAAFLGGATDALALFGVWLGVWLIAGAISELAVRIKLGQASLGDSWRRLRGLPRSSLGTTVAHAGLGLTVLGLVVASTWGAEAIRTVKPGETIAIAGYALTFDGVAQRPGPNFSEIVAHFSVAAGGREVTTLDPSRRTFQARQDTTTEAAISTLGFSQLYVSLGDIASDGSATVRAYFKPLVTFIWLGAMVMALGGLLSLSDRRLRVGAPRPARQRAAAPTAPAE
jgi:cytochrome c-type biogenesis protein CcmF